MVLLYLINRHFLCLISYYPLLFCQWHYPAENICEVSPLKDWQKRPRQSLEVQSSFWLGTQRRGPCRHCGPLLNYLTVFSNVSQSRNFFYFISPLFCHRIASACCTRASDIAERSLWAAKKHLPKSFYTTSCYPRT